MTDVARRDALLALAAVAGASSSAADTPGGEHFWSEAAISGLAQVMQALCFDYWSEQPLRLADFVA